MDTTLTAILLGIVEGLTEFLPVSSTGHLILATELLGYDAERWAVFNIAIQPGAILAVAVLYWRTFWEAFIGLFRWDPKAVAFVRNLLVAFTPAVVLGLAFGDQIEVMLENATIVAWALIIGGFAILAVEHYADPQESGGVAALSLRQSALVGAVQCLAMVPGVSRSGATILGAMAMGVDRKTAAEFSFFLALPTLTGATVLQLWKHGSEIGTGAVGWGEIAIGFVVAFVVALAVIKAFVAYISRHGFKPFAWYRIVIGVAALAWFALR
ncbi:undecaprenyl-diphosphate phosphatase [Erythrobacter arachoides]|uniref:Undecaprenyl-diphosphatase n=1 Tax=Aurantiacibacter arachoides TaxID=1850444 RepID=A0A844ZYI9_9SPHN|nr:undecaprenyl-diphosphate phosphatase [Aurantiacibacter arachoides]MXO92006.1 undecaprenyl-diphosphate phosphatase [Aurantiacibacter arachoides]GGD60499.1 undecaprenyl-diphosphatase [Aurantiacibacter arachoides]